MSKFKLKKLLECNLDEKHGYTCCIGEVRMRLTIESDGERYIEIIEPDCGEVYKSYYRDGYIDGISESKKAINKLYDDKFEKKGNK